MNRKILFLPISGRAGASTRYRMWSYLPAIRQAGLDPVLLEPGTVGNRRGLGRILNQWREEKRILELGKDADLIFIQKRLFRTGFVMRLKALGKPIVFDWDDAIYTSPRQDWSSFTRCKVERRLHGVLASADIVICGSRYLFDYASQQLCKRVVYLPTVVDTAAYPLKNTVSADVITLGWIGSAVNLPYLGMLRPVFMKLASCHPSLRLLVISNGQFQASGIEVINRAWQESQETNDLLEMSVGLMPMPDNVWSRGKCGLKAIQYMACGLPVVISPVGANNELVNHGEHGYLANTEAEWHRSLESLIKDPALRQKMGHAGRKRVEAKYSLAVNARNMVDILNNGLSLVSSNEA